MTATAPVAQAVQPATPFLGLAPFLRQSIAGIDLMPAAQAMLASAETQPDDANLWMNLATAMLCLGHRDLGLSIQAQALEIDRIYRRPAAIQPARFRLLMLMMPGDLAENTPLDCLLESSDVDLICYYLSPEAPFALPIPEHDAVMVALGDSDANQPMLSFLAHALADWPKPVINPAQHIPATERGALSQIMQRAPGVVMPTTYRVKRRQLAAVADGRLTLAELAAGLAFPVILRPVGSQAGRDLDRIDDPAALAAYLTTVDEPDFFLARFIDYSSSDGLFRKFRIALIGGRPFACHMAVSAHWMVHYVNAGMYEDAAKRAEEAEFMANFEHFAERHRAALEAIHQRLKLDYFCIDCAETQDGQLLIFEADHVMVVHAMDQEALFPYKQQHMRKAERAFRDFLLGLGG
jgi:glutathione synthase/RimK-type ligase-like ATP-grasp enzyme